MVFRISVALAFCFLLFLPRGADAGGSKVLMLDKDGVAQGTAVLKLSSGSVKAKLLLAALPATVDTGAELFEATIYKAYLVSSLDEAVEVPLGSVYPKPTGKARIKTAFKGDLSQLGLDRLVIVAFSKDGLSSFDVLTGSLEIP